MWTPHLEGVVESVDGRWVHGAHHLQNAVEVIELLKDLQDLDDARYDGHTLLYVLRFYDAPEKHEKALETNTYVTLEHKTSHKGQFFEIKMYASSESWINKLSIDVWFVMIGQYL